MKKYPDDVMPGDWLTPKPEIAHEFDGDALVHRVAIYEAADTKMRSFSVIPDHGSLRKRLAEYGPAWFEGFARQAAERLEE